MGEEARTSTILIPVSCLPYPLRRTVQQNRYHKTSLPGAVPFATRCPSSGSDPKAYLVMSSLPPESEQLFVLPGHKVDSSVLQQGGEHEEQAHRHPDVNGFHIGHLRWWGGAQRREGRADGIRSVVQCFLLLRNSPPPPLLSPPVLGY